MAASGRITSDALATELAKIPAFTHANAKTLDAVRIAVAKAIASGQSADELAADMGIPAAWKGIDLTKPPTIPDSGGGLRRVQETGPAAPAEPVPAPRPGPIPTPAPVPTPTPTPTPGRVPPDWAKQIIPIALKDQTTTRMVVLDREPTALGGLELPAWARGQKPAAVYGPVAVTSPDLQAITLKWILIFRFTGVAQFVRSGTVLCVVPISILRFGQQKQADVTAGSAWIAVNPFASAAPAGSFAGIAVNSGHITSDQPLSLSGNVVTVAAGARLDLQLALSPMAAGPAGFPAIVTAPASVTVGFPVGGAPSIAFSGCAATIYSQTVTCTGSNPGASYSPQLNMLIVPGKFTAGTFSPAPVTGKLIELTGSAPEQIAGWAFSVSQVTNPTQLGAASGPGDFVLACGAGMECKWPGLTKPEPEGEAIFLAQNAALVLFLISNAPKGVVTTQAFDLWVDRDSSTGARCELVATRSAGQIVTYALLGANEIVEIGAALEARVDRPLLASGARVPAEFVTGLVALIRNASGNRLMAASASPLPANARGFFPMALDNALLEVSEPDALFLNARADSSFNATDGQLMLLFGYILAELYLPDPYTGNVGLLARQPGTNAGASATAGYLISSVKWPAPDKPALRLFDTAHTHPATPPDTEASTPAVAPAKHFHISPIPLPHLETGLETTQKSAAVEHPSPESDKFQAKASIPNPDPLPQTAPGVVLLDVSTRASQLGVEVTTNERLNALYTIDGLSLRGPAVLLPLTTLPAIAWEPMYDRSTVSDPPVSDSELLHPPGDGPLTQVRSLSATLIPISPLQSLQSVLDGGTGKFTARLTLPFGMVGAIEATTQNGTVLPNVSLVQPTFNATLTPTGVPYTGAYQLSVSAPNPAQPDPILAGRTYLRMPNDQPPLPALSYGEMVLGSNASLMFELKFDPPAGSPLGTGVPLRRYDLTGYGASTFSEWTAQHPAPTDVIKAHFHVLVGRTSREVIQVQSVIYPWAVKVVRTITIDRQGSGVEHRVDSGWQPASDGLFQFDAPSTGITRDKIHAGVVGGVIQVKSIEQLGLIVQAPGTPDIGKPGAPKPIPVQPVTFDAEVIIDPKTQVLQGGAKSADLSGALHTCVPSKGITGYIPLQPDYHLSLTDMANFGMLAAGAGGPISATLNAGASNHLLRVTEFDAVPVNDGATGGQGIACAVRGVPKLSSDGSWSVAARKQGQTAPVPIPATKGAPLVQPNKSGGTTPGDVLHYANPEDIFRLATGSATAPDTLYGFLQSVGTQSNLLSRPMLTVGSDDLSLADALNVAHAGALLGAISSFPPIANCLNFISSDLQPIKNQLAAPSLSTAQNLYLKDPVRKTPIPLITTSVADVNLYFYQKGDDLTKKADPANVVMSLGSPTPPSFSLDVNHLAIGLVIHALGSNPVIWFQGGFHADSDSIPSFPDLQTQFDSPLDVLATIFTVLNDFASVLSPGSGSGLVKAGADSGGGAGLQVSFSNGKLVVSDGFTLPDIPLGLGTISNVSLDIGTTLDILALTIDFLVSIGTPDAPCHWIVDPLSGTLCLQAGIVKNKVDFLIQAGIGLGLAIDLGIASGSASIVIAVQVKVQGSVVTLLLLLNGQAQVSVLGGLASAAITLTAGLGFSIDLANLDINLIGTASVGIHISICWVVNISWSGSWTFQKELPYNPLLHS